MYLTSHFERMTMKKHSDLDSGSIETKATNKVLTNTLRWMNLFLTMMAAWAFPNACVITSTVCSISACSFLHYMVWENKEFKKVMGKKGTFFRKYMMEHVAFNILILWAWSMGASVVFWMLMDQIRINRPQICKDADYYLG